MLLRAGGAAGLGAGGGEYEGAGAARDGFGRAMRLSVDGAPRLTGIVRLPVALPGPALRVLAALRCLTAGRSTGRDTGRSERDGRTTGRTCTGRDASRTRTPGWDRTGSSRLSPTLRPAAERTSRPSAVTRR